MELTDIKGKINDVDSHEMILPTKWGEVFGEVGAMLGPVATARLKEITGDIDVGLDASADDEAMQVTQETVESIRGFTAPGASNFDTRLQVMNVQGVNRQIMFPMFGLFSLMLESTKEAELKKLGLDLGENAEQVVRMITHQIQTAHNEWAKGVNKQYGDRIAATAVISTLDKAQLMADTQDMISSGMPSITISCGTPPGGMSPGHPDMDDFWALCAAANLPILMHVGADKGFRSSDVWREMPQLESELSDTGEVPLDAFSLDTTYLPARNYLSAMVMGGVFERHPNLRVGVVELGSSWAGPMAESMDMYADLFAKKMAKVLSAKPSEYVNRNIRFSTFYFEPIDLYMDRYGLEDIYCFSTDYPHPEGGRTPLEGHYQRLKNCGDTVLEKFFYQNADWIMPANYQ